MLVPCRVSHPFQTDQIFCSKSWMCVTICQATIRVAGCCFVWVLQFGAVPKCQLWWIEDLIAPSHQWWHTAIFAGSQSETQQKNGFEIHVWKNLQTSNSYWHFQSAPWHVGALLHLGYHCSRCLDWFPVRKWSESTTWEERSHFSNCCEGFTKKSPHTRNAFSNTFRHEQTKLLFIYFHIDK